MQSLALLLLGLRLFLTIQEVGASIKQIYEFPDSTFLENIHVRTEGSLLLTSVNSGELYTLDPTAAAPLAVSVANLTGSTGLTGMATIGPDLYAVSGGMHSKFIFDNNSMQVYVVRIPGNSDGGIVLESIRVLDTQMLNGMAVLYKAPWIVLSADSIGGRIFRINTFTSKVDVAFADASLGPGDNAAVPLGANGLKVHNGYLYFTNSGQGTFARIKINDDGTKAGNVQILARLQGAITVTNAYDDFTFDNKGNAYVALHSYTIVKIAPDGTQTIFAGGVNTTEVKEPTSAALAKDGKSVYISTGGTTLDGMVYRGQVLQAMI